MRRRVFITLQWSEDLGKSAADDVIIAPAHKKESTQWTQGAHAMR